MLLALTRRPLRLRNTSLLKAAGQLGQLGRRPRMQAELVTDRDGVLIIAHRGLHGLVLRPCRRHLHHALRRAGHRARDHRIRALVGVTQRSPQHRHIDAGDHLDLHAVGQPLRHVARRRAEHVGEDDRFGVAHLREHFARARLDLLAGSLRRRRAPRACRAQSGNACCATAFSDDASGAWAMIISPGMAADYRQFGIRRDSAATARGAVVAPKTTGTTAAASA